MKWLNVVQGGEEWRNAHLGIPTASQFHRIVTPKELKASSQATRYLCELVAERMTGATVVDAQSMWMERGTTLEQGAAAAYEFEHGVKVSLCGFALTDDGRIGASPDRIVGDDGLLELKNPSAHVHIRYLLYGLEAEYRMQLQGQLYVTGKQWVDFRSQCPGLPPFELRVYRDKDALDALHAALPVFCSAVDAAHEKILMWAMHEEVAS